MIGNLFNHGFEMPPPPEELPEWADSYFYKFQQCFWDELWKEGGSAIATLEREMIEARYSYIKEGMILEAFYLGGCYKDFGFKTFKNYCVKRLKKSYFCAKQLISGARMAWHLLCEGFTELPDNVSQASRLGKVAKENKEEYDPVVASWTKVLESASQKAQALTANFIEEAVTGVKPEPKANVKLPKKLWEKLTKKAKKLGKTPQELLEELVSSDEEDEISVDPSSAEPESETNLTKFTAEKPLERKPWTEDLQDLLTEHNIHNRHYDTT